MSTLSLNSYRVNVFLGTWIIDAESEEMAGEAVYKLVREHYGENIAQAVIYGDAEEVQHE